MERSAKWSEMSDTDFLKELIDAHDQNRITIGHYLEIENRSDDFLETEPEIKELYEAHRTKMAKNAEIIAQAFLGNKKITETLENYSNIYKNIVKPVIDLDKFRMSIFPKLDYQLPQFKYDVLNSIPDVIGVKSESQQEAKKVLTQIEQTNNDSYEELQITTLHAILASIKEVESNTKIAIKRDWYTNTILISTVLGVVISLLTLVLKK